jgi:hypothetical protein
MEGKNMKKNVLMILMFGISMLFVGCASTVQYVKFPDQSKIIEDTTKARIYVLRPVSAGSAISMEVKDNNVAIGKTGPNGYLCWEREAGKITITGKAENTSMLELEVVPNTVYYVQQQVKPGFFIARNKLIMVPQDKIEKFKKRCKAPILENKK